MTVPVRKFEMGCSILTACEFLKTRGYTAKSAHGRAGFNVIGPNGGRPKRMNQHQFYDLLDSERKKLGLEPIRKRG